MKTVSPSINLYSKEERKLFPKTQQRFFSDIAKNYKLLHGQYVDTVILPESGTHKEWIAARVTMHVNSAIMRLLYLTESFAHSANAHNGVACSTLVKGMVEIPLHLGYLVWVLSSDHNFKKVRRELDKMAFGSRDAKTGLTSVSKVNNKEMYQKTDEQMGKLFEDKKITDIFERLYKESNAVGHHNYEATMFCGLQNGDTWHSKDRKENFIFLTSKIFQIFLYVSTILFMSNMFLKAIRHYQKHMPDYLE